MSKSKKLFGLGVLLAIIFGICYFVWRGQPHPSRADSLGPKRDEINPASVVEGDLLPQSQQADAKAEDVVETMKAIEQFDIAMRDLRNKNGEEWVAGLKSIASDVNRLAKRSDFETFTAATLMIKRISDLAIARLISGEVAAGPTSDALSAINYRTPSDQELIRFIGQYYSDADQEQKKKAPESVLEFLSRFEPEVIFPDEQWIAGKTMSAMISERNATLSLLSIAWAKPQLEFAQVTALYLARGGNRSFRGKELEADLEKRVGKEISLISSPKFVSSFVNTNASVTDISNAVDAALIEFERNGASRK